MRRGNGQARRRQHAPKLPGRLTLVALMFGVFALGMLVISLGVIYPTPDMFCGKYI